MLPGLFRPVLDVRPTPRATRFSAVPVSIAAHVVVVLAAVVIPLLATDVLPLVPFRESWMPAAVLPAPPPAPASSSRRVQPVPAQNPNAAPFEAPHGISDSSLELTPAAPVDSGFEKGVVDGSIDGGRLLASSYDVPPPPPSPRVPVRVGPQVKQPVKLVDVQPVYPDAARQARIEGVVIIEAVIGPTGDVQEARVLRSRPLLDEAALAAVRQWKFTPTLLNGIPIPVVMTVTVNFTLR
jgi:protein TonB